MLKKIISIALSLVLVLSAFCTAVFAAGIGGGKKEAVMQINYVNLTEDMTSLKNGNYKVPAGTTINLKDSISVEGKVNLLLEDGAVLNGPEAAYWAIGLQEDATLNIRGTGKILGSIFANNAEINLYGGTIECPIDFSYCIDAEFDSEFNMFGGSLENSYFGVNLQEADFEMYGGSITNCNVGVQAYDAEIKLLGGKISECGTGVYFSSSEITLGGSIKIEDNKTCGIDLWSPECLFISKEILPTEEMHVGLGLSMYKPACGEEAIISEIPGKYAQYFFCDDKECILKNDKGVLKVLNIIEEAADDYYPSFKLLEDAFPGKTIEYQWYAFEGTEINNDEKYISVSSKEDARYENVNRSYSKKNNAWIVENPISDEVYYEDNVSAADYILHIPDNTYLTFHGVLQGIQNQYVVGVKKDDVEVTYSSYENMGSDLETYLEKGGDYDLFSFYYLGEDEPEETVTSDIVYSHIKFWTKNAQSIGNESSLNDNSLTPGYYVCVATVKDGSAVVDTFESDIIWAGGEKPFYDEEDMAGYGLSASIFAMPQGAFIICGIVLVIAIVVVVLSKKKKTSQENQ